MSTYSTSSSTSKYLFTEKADWKRDKDSFQILFLTTEHSVSIIHINRIKCNLHMSQAHSRQALGK